MFDKIKKRNGEVVNFDASKITNAIFKAGQATGEFGIDVAKKLTLRVLDIAIDVIGEKIPTVEEIQDIVEEVLISSPYKKTAKAYIIYRDQHAKIREITTKASLDLVDQYLRKVDWRVNENSNMSFSLQGLNNYVSSEITKTYWLNNIYPPEIRNAYINGDIHIHDLGCLSVYCVGWDLQDLLAVGFKGAAGKVESSPAKHFRSALGQVVNFFYTLQGEAAGAQAFSFDASTPITIKRNGKIESVTLEMLFDDYKHHMIGINGSQVIYTDRIYRRYLMDDADKRKYMDSRMPTEPVLFQFDKIEVLTEEGFVPLKAISRHKISSEDDKLLIIETEDGNILRITKSHPVILSDGKTVRADSLKIGDEILSANINIPLTEEIEMEENFAYLIGFMIAEGCWGHQTKEYAIVSQKKNKPEREKVESIIKKLKIPYYNQGDFNIVFSTTRTGRFIRNHLRLQDKSHRKNLPDFIFRLSRKSIGALISGLIDGDGDIDRNRIVRIHSTSYTLLMQLKQLLSLLGINATVRYTSYKNMKENYKDTYIIRFRLTEKDISLFNHSLKLSSIKPKEKDSPSFSSKIVKIMNARYDNEYVYDITTQNQHFLINNIVVHNSNFDTLLAPFIRYDNLDYKGVKQAMQEFLFNVNVPTRTGFQTPFVNLTLDLTVPEIYKNQPVIVGGEFKNETYSEFQKEMDMLNRAFLEVMLEGDAKKRVFTFPIPTYNITKDFDWENPNMKLLWEVTAKYGIPYFSNFINSDMKPDDVRSMCIAPSEEILIRNSKNIKRKSIKEVVEKYKKSDFDRDGWAECNKEKNLEVLSLNYKTGKVEWAKVIRFLKVKDNKLITIITEEGKEIKCSSKHLVPVLTEKGIVNKFAQDVKEGDYLLNLKKFSGLNNKYQKIEKDLILDEDLAKILGFFTADGNYLFETRKNIKTFGQPKGLQFTFNSQTKSYLKEIKGLIKKVFGLTGKEKKDSRYNSYYLYVHNAKIARTLFNAGFKKYGRLPDILFNSPSTVIENFLLYHFKGDGYEKRKEIHINDKELGRDLVILYSLIGKPVTYRRRKNSQVIYIQHNKKKIRKDGVLTPPLLSERVPGFLAKSTYLVPGLKKSRMVGFNTLEKCQAFTELSSDIKNSDYYVVRVKKVEKKFLKKPQTFFDLELEKNHLFVHSLGAITHNCCRLRLDNRELRKRGGGLFGANPLTGSIGVVTINLPRIGYLSKTKEEFKQRLESQMELAKESLEIKRKILEKFTDEGLYPYSRFYLRNVKEKTNQYWTNHFSTIGLIGMNEACLNLFGKDIGTEEGLSFAIEIMNFMREKLLKFQEETGNIYNLEATPAEGTSYRLARIDKNKYPDIICANEENYKNGAEPFYTNSSQLPVNYTDDIFHALELQDKLQTLYTGGTVFHIFVGEKIHSSEGIKNLVKTVCENFHLPYFTITPTFSICPNDGYISGEHFECPKCGAECEVYSRVVGYLRPVNQWNKGKQEEFKIRKTFAVK